MLQRLFGGPASGFRAARLAAQHSRQGQTVRVQRVRLFKARNFFRTVTIGGGVTLVCWHLYTSAVISPLLRQIDKLEASLSPKEKEELDKEMEDVDNSIFIAFPFTTKQINSRPYTGNDPEWLQFGVISKDKQLMKKIRNDLAETVRRAVERHPIVVHRCGKNMKMRRYWLDIDFPYRPPPTFEQSGLLIADDGISWASEPVDSLTVFRLRKILWPSAMAQSSWAFTTAMARHHWSEVKKSLGFQPTEPPHPSTRSRTETLFPSPGRQMPDGSPAGGPSNAVNKTTDSRQQQSESGSGGKTNFLKDFAISHADGARQMSSGPWMEFRRKLAQTWKPTRDYPPRGSIVVSGFVEVETPKGYIVVDVWSHWNPQTEKFDTRSMWMNVRRIQMKVQAPARG